MLIYSSIFVAVPFSLSLFLSRLPGRRNAEFLFWPESSIVVRPRAINSRVWRRNGVCLLDPVRSRRLHARVIKRFAPGDARFSERVLSHARATTTSALATCELATLSFFDVARCRSTASFGRGKWGVRSSTRAQSDCSYDETGSLSLSLWLSLIYVTRHEKIVTFL